MTTKDCCCCCCLLHDVKIKCSFKIIENEGILTGEASAGDSDTSKGRAATYQDGRLASLRNIDNFSASNNSNSVASEVLKDMAWSSIPRFNGCDAQRMLQIHCLCLQFVRSTRLFHQEIMESFQGRNPRKTQRNVQACRTKWLILFAEQFAVHSIDQSGCGNVSSHISAQDPHHCFVLRDAAQETH